LQATGSLLADGIVVGKILKRAAHIKDDGPDGVDRHLQIAFFQM
jgi:hypothetical protein